MEIEKILLKVYLLLEKMQSEQQKQSPVEDVLYGYNARKALKTQKEQEQSERLAQALLAKLSLTNQPPPPKTVVDPRIDDMSRKVAQLEVTLQAAQQKVALYEKEQPRLVNAASYVEEKFKYQLPIVKAFLDTRVRKNPTAKILNHDLNNALIDFAEEGDVHIETYEVAKLMRHFGIDYSPSNGKLYYRGIEFVLQTQA